MTRPQKLVILALMTAALASVFVITNEFFFRFTAVFVYAAFARAVWKV